MAQMIDEKRAKKLYRSGVPVPEIAKKYHVSREAIYKHLRRMDDFEKLSQKLHEDKIRERNERWEKDRKEIRERLIKGEDLNIVHLDYDYPWGKVEKEFSKLNKKIAQMKLRERNEKILKFYKEGLTQVELSQEFGLSQAQISRILKKNG